MTHGSGYARTVAAAAALIALTPTAAHAATAPKASASGATVTVTDGCGRVDSLSIDVAGDYWLEVLPDGKASKDKPVIDDNMTPEEQLAAQAGYIAIGDSWTRSADASKSFVSIRVLEFDATRNAFVYLPLVLAGADGAGVRGTDQMRLTNEDCVQPEAPTFTDEEGAANDTVTIPSVTGVKYSGKPGVSPGKGTVTVTATADKGYRLAAEDGTPLSASDTRWTFTFDGTATVQVPDSKAPAFKLGAPIPATKSKSAGRGPNVVVVRYVPGVTWVVDGKQVKVTDKQTIVEVPVGDKTSVEVQAVSADPKAFAVSGETEWTVGSAGSTTKPKGPTVVAPGSGVVVSGKAVRSLVTWSPAPGFPANSMHNLRYREIRLTGNDVRAAAPWRPWGIEAKARRGELRAKPGAVFEVQAQSVSGRRVSPWSAPTTVWFPIDVAPKPTKFFTVEKVKPAFGGTMLTSKQRNTAWSARTGVTNEVRLWFGTSPKGAPAAVFVDGKRVSTIQTRSKKAAVRQVLKPIPVRWGHHVVTVVHAGKNGQALQIDGVAFGR